MGTWFSLFNNWETFLGQFIALLIVLGSYVAAQYLRVWRPRKRGLQAAQRATAVPSVPADSAGGDVAVADPLASLLT
jgi:high-affinity iron transporter